jgi:ribosome-associated translation inhibitor RaiA
MALNVQVKNFDLEASDEQYIQKRLAKLDRLIPVGTSDAQLDVYLDKHTGKEHGEKLYGAEIRVDHGGEHHVVTARASSIRPAVVEAVKQLKREVVTSRDKQRSLVRRGADKLGAMFRK